MPWEYPGFCYQTLCKNCHSTLKGMLDERREAGCLVFEEWESGLNFFGDRIFDMFAESVISQQGSKT